MWNQQNLDRVPELMAPATERENSERLYIRAQELGAPMKQELPTFELLRNESMRILSALYIHIRKSSAILDQEE